MLFAGAQQPQPDPGASTCARSQRGNVKRQVVNTLPAPTPARASSGHNNEPGAAGLLLRRCLCLPNGALIVESVGKAVGMTVWLRNLMPC